MNKEKPHIIPNIVAAITILLSFHYFISYTYSSGYLQLQGLNPFPILTFEDITFPMGRVNTEFLMIPFLVLMVPVFMGFFLTEKSFKKASESTGKGLKWIEKINVNNKKNKTILILLTGLMVVLLGFMIWQILEIDTTISRSQFVLFIMFLVLLLAYLFCFNWRPQILVTYIFAVFLTTYAHINNVLREQNLQEENTRKELSKLYFDYQGERIQTSDSLQLIFHGYKYLILKKSDGAFQLYPTQDVGMLYYNPSPCK